jgi:hypothetical protein
MDGGNYVEIASGKISEVYENDHNMYAEGCIITTADIAIWESGGDCVSYNSVQDPPKKDDKKNQTADIIYLDEDGTEINRKPDPTITVNKTFIIKTTKVAEDIYTRDERKTELPAHVSSISNKDSRDTKKDIKSSNFQSINVVKNTVEIQSKDVLQKMYGNIKDDGTGGESDANNREYGGNVKDGSVTSGTGAVSNPSINTIADIEVNGGSDQWHSHPSGYRGDPPPTIEDEKEKASSTSSNSTISGSYNSQWFMQGPSKPDQNNIGTFTGYVFAIGVGFIYIYDSSGVVAVLNIAYVK